MQVFRVDEDNNDDEHFYVDVLGKGTVMIIANQDGVSVDIFPFQVVDKPLASMYVLNEDFEEEEGDFAHCESCDKIINKDTETFVVYEDDTYCAQCALKEKL